MVRLAAITLFLLSGAVLAGDKAKPPEPDVAPSQTQNQAQSQDQSQDQHTEVTVDAATTAVAESRTDQANTQSMNVNSGPDVILVPNNNTANCLRVFGISFANPGGGGGIGFPYRDKSCDFEQAADDAAAAGQHKLAWHWRCHKPNLYRAYRQGRGKKAAIAACTSAMWRLLEPACDPDDRLERMFEKCQQK